jgi:peptidoglycan/LPS O-acetylase OafA/YrhL
MPAPGELTGIQTKQPGQQTKGEIPMSVSNETGLPPAEEKRYFWLTILYVLLLLSAIVIVSLVVWDKPTYFIMYVPVPILEWAFVGGMLAVLYRLAYRKKLWNSSLGLYTWIIAKPILGLFMGALVYFVALGGGILLGAPPDALRGEQIYWLSVVAFFGGFSDELSLGVIRRIVSKAMDHEDEKNQSA